MSKTEKRSEEQEIRRDKKSEEVKVGRARRRERLAWEIRMI